MEENVPPSVIDVSNKISSLERPTFLRARILTISSDPSKNIIRVYYRSVTKEEPIEIPNTMVNGPKDNNSLLYLLILLNIMLSSIYVTRKNN